MRLAKKAEKLGFGCLWLQEGGRWGSIPLAAAILTNTETIRVGTGIVSPFRRHPTVLAEEAAALGELSSGRFVLGIGSGPSQLKTMGLNVSQLEGLREAVEILRNTFRGERFTYPGKVFRILTASGPTFPREMAPPIYLGGLMPKMIELAAEVADGLLISRRGGSSPSYVSEVIKSVRRVRQTNSLSKQFTVRSFIESSIDEDDAKARRCAKQFLSSYTIPLMPRSVMQKTGLGGDTNMEKSNTFSEEAVDGRMIDEFSMTGTPSECLEKLATFEGTGLEVPILYLHGPSIEAALELAGSKILPRIIQ